MTAILKVFQHNSNASLYQKREQRQLAFSIPKKDIFIIGYPHETGTGINETLFTDNYLLK